MELSCSALEAPKLLSLIIALYSSNCAKPAGNGENAKNLYLVLEAANLFDL